MTTTTPRGAHRAPRAAQPRTGLRTAVRVLAAVVVALAAAVPVLPDLLGLDTRSPFAQLAAFRPWAVTGVAALGLVVELASIRWRSLRPAAAGLLAVALVGAVLVLPRLVPDPVPAGGRPLTVLAFNTWEGGADPEGLAELIAVERPDLVAVVEAGPRFGARLAPLVQALGYRVHATQDTRGEVENVTALVTEGLGDVDVTIGGSTSRFPTVEVTGGGLGDVRFVAYHSVAPVPGTVPQWRSDLAVLQQWCGTGGPVVVAGDMNATLDHSALRAGMAGCVDAAEQRGAGLVPTWGPTDRSRRFGPQIDHVLLGGGIGAETFSVHDVAGSDHRAVVTRLRVPS
jgi:endonuclease/exonuclease/phosphatase (EEP) superfamily protein YafD